MRITAARTVPRHERRLVLQNRQRGRRVELRFLRRIVRNLLEGQLGLNEYDLGIRLVGMAAITRLNERFLGHAGATDVISFDYAEGKAPRGPRGELVICVDQACRQARTYRTTWQSELVRYVVHGILHLQGYDDRCAAGRRRMKGREDELLRRLARGLDLRQLDGQPRPGRALKKG